MMSRSVLSSHMLLAVSILSVSFLTPTTSAASAYPPLKQDAHDHDHDHGHDDETHTWEWSGVFEVHRDEGAWFTLVASHHTAHIETMEMMWGIASCDETDLQATEYEAEVVGEEGVVSNGGVIHLNTTMITQLVLDEASFVTSVVVEVDVFAAQCVAVFFEHHPEEIEIEGVHFLKHAAGDDAESLTEEEETSRSKPWGKSTLAVFITVLPTVLGIVIFSMLPNSDFVLRYANCFAGGALMSASFLHMYPEAMQLASYDEIEKFWKTGTVVLAGYMISPLITYVLTALGLPNPHVDVHSHPSNQDKAAALELQPTMTNSDADMAREDGTRDSGVVVGKGVHWGTVGGILIADGCHNFVDGVIIAVAFSTCSDSIGWAITLAVVSHELPQELGDYFILRDNGLSVTFALLTNFMSGCVALLGMIAVLAGDPLTNNETAGLLLFSVGMFLYIGASHIVPQLLSEMRPDVVALQSLFFIGGAILVGLSLLQHDHCDPPGSGHEGHNH